MLRTTRILRGQLLAAKATAAMHRAEAAELRTDLRFALDSAKELRADNRRLTANLKGAEALYAAAMKRIEDLEMIIAGVPAIDTGKEIES